MGEFITKDEFTAFKELAKSEHEKLKEENNWQGKQIARLDDIFKILFQHSNSIEKLSTNIEYLVKELTKQTERLSTLENKDGQMWRNFLGYLVAGGAGMLVTMIFR